MTASATATARPDADAGDISARTVWIVILAAYAVMMTLAWFAPAIVQGNALHPVTGQPNWEWGLFEQTQNVTLALTLGLAVFLAFRAEDALMRGWLVLIALAALFLLGEETSWGQHYFRWGTEGWFAANNDQAETNIHNTPGGWFDQKPRALLQVGMVVGAVIHPLVKLWRGRGLFDQPWWLAPTLACLAPVAFAFISGAPKNIDKLGLFPFELQFYRASELEECFMYAFFVVYLLSLGSRLRFRREQDG